MISQSVELSARPDATRAAALRLGGYSFLILFLELALIRYVPGHVRVFAFFINLVLMATFLGMGVGLLQSEHARRLRWLAVPTLLALFGAVKYFANVMVGGNIVHDEYLWGQFLTTSPNVQHMGTVPVATILFAFCVFVFVPLGGLLGAEFRKFPPLHAYSIDVAGSLIGVLAFAVASALWTPPIVWFGAALAIWVLLSLDDWKFAAALAATGIAVLGLIQWSGGAQVVRSGSRGTEYWSPYYRIDLYVEPHLYTVDVNGSLHQYMLDLSLESAKKFPQMGKQRDAYLKPLKLVPRIDTALVLGSGTGNDVALLLQLGAKHIDAVEIDPTILTLGKALHFQQPYSDPRVRAHVNDARAFSAAPASTTT